MSKPGGDDGGIAGAPDDNPVVDLVPRTNLRVGRGVRS